MDRPRPSADAFAGVVVIAPQSEGEANEGCLDRGRDVVASIVGVAQQLTDSEGKPPRLYVITRGAQSVTTGDQVRLDHGGVRGLLRVSRIDAPEAALLSPDQAFFLRENLKLKLLNARMGLLARQSESLQADMSASAALVRKYFDMNSLKVQQALKLIEQSQAQLRKGEMPRLDGTLSALATAAAGR
jgi:hypothetical protein